jgi:adenosylhomocysteine nucleosidase
MMKILVTFAVDAEFAPWRALRAFRRVAAEPVPMFASESPDGILRVALTGMGPAAASRAAEWLFAEPYDLCVTSGLAGGLKRQYRAGQVLVARAVREARTGRELVCDAATLETARRSGARPVARFLTREDVVQSAGEKSALGMDADAVEMESYIILERAARAGIPAAAIRAVSDPVETNLPLDFNRVVDGRGQIRAGALLRQVARQPQRVPALVRLGVESRRAAVRLAGFLERFAVELFPADAEPVVEEVVA